jgi:hypothetical protein
MTTHCLLYVLASVYVHTYLYTVTCTTKQIPIQYPAQPIPMDTQVLSECLLATAPCVVLCTHTRPWVSAPQLLSPITGFNGVNST